MNNINSFKILTLTVFGLFFAINISEAQVDSTKINAFPIVENQQVNITQINKLPVVNFNISTVSGGPYEAPVWLKFYPSGTYDPDGYIILFEIDMNGDGLFDVQEKTLTGGSFEFTIPGDYTAIVRVTDDKGGVTTESKIFTIIDPIGIYVDKYDDMQQPIEIEQNIESDVSEQVIESEPAILDQNVDLEESEPMIENVSIDDELNKKLDSIIEEYKVEEEISDVVEEEKAEAFFEPVKEKSVYIDSPIIKDERVVEPIKHEEIPESKSEHIEIGKIKEELIVIEQEPIIKVKEEIISEPSINALTISEDAKIQLSADSYVYAYSYRNWNDANFGKHDVITAGWHSTGGEKRIYLKFDVPNTDINSIDKATLKLYYKNRIGKNSATINIYQVKENWVEGKGTFREGQAEPIDSSGAIIWNIQPAFNDSVITQFKPKKKYNKWIEIDITSLVKEWLGDEPNYGIVLKPDGILSGRIPTSIYEFYSREYDDETKIPYIEIQIK